MTKPPETGNGLLTLTTDFGTVDHYVGAMKGVVANLAPGVRVVDITHGIPRHDIHEGSYAIAQSYGYFPAGSVHVVVVDPGVGSSRCAIAARAGEHFFIAPDNGVLSQVLEAEDAWDARRIRARHGLSKVSTTFHGRDLFAPAASRLASGLAFAHLGPAVERLHRLAPAAVIEGMGRVLHVDGFGNLVTSFRPQDLPGDRCLAVAGTAVCTRADSYAAMRQGRLFLIEGSSGYLEISINRGSAAEFLGAWAGAEVAVAG